MKHVDIEEMVTAAVPVPVVAKMTRAEKLNRWADLVRNYQGGELQIFHNLEYWPDYAMRETQFGPMSLSAFGVAVADAAFREQGLPNPANLVDIMHFFDIDQAQLHEFSCDCGGYISNRQQADQIANLTNRPRTIAGFFRRIGAAIC